MLRAPKSSGNERFHPYSSHNSQTIFTDVSSLSLNILKENSDFKRTIYAIKESTTRDNSCEVNGDGEIVRTPILYSQPEDKRNRLTEDENFEIIKNYISNYNYKYGYRYPSEKEENAYLDIRNNLLKDSKNNNKNKKLLDGMKFSIGRKYIGVNISCYGEFIFVLNAMRNGIFSKYESSVADKLKSQLDNNELPGISAKAISAIKTGASVYMSKNTKEKKLRGHI